MENVILYTTHCPRCLVLANKLQEKGIHYTEFTDVQKMFEMGMDMMPVLQVGKKQYGFKEAIKIVGGM